MSSNQPLPAARRAVRNSSSRNRAEAPLIRLWIDLALRMTSAAAHGSTDEAPLLAQLIVVEEALDERFPSCRPLLDELRAWEASLIHVSDGETSPDRCLICRRAKLSLPPQLPLPVKGGAR